MTLSGKTLDYYVICAEINERIIPITIWPFIVQCQQIHFPVKLYVAIPAGTQYPELSVDFARARNVGVGILLVDSVSKIIDTLNDPLSLSLSGLRRAEIHSFPKKYRSLLSDAERTFLNGDPNKGCSNIYDEIESLTRKIAHNAHKKGYWNQPRGNPNTIWSMPFASLIKNMKSNLNFQNSNPPITEINDVLLSRIHGITSPRNASAHKPKSMKELIERDGRLRTRMEEAVDLLLDLIKAGGKLL